jgi:hypothetical protein
MAKATLRDMAVAIAPPWLQDDVGGAILRASCLVLDALSARLVEGVKLRFPQATTYTALGYIGNDRLLERGPGQTHAGYAAQLVKAVETWQNAGGARTVLSQLRAYFAPANGQPMRLVTDGYAGAHDFNVWHEIDTTTGYVTRTEVVTRNWDWGLHRWWYGWVIIDVSGRWTMDKWGDPGTWGDGGVWGSNATQAEVYSLNAIVKKWAPANMQKQIIFTFASGTLTRTSGDHPTGAGYTNAWQLAQNANFLAVQGL